MANSYVRYFGIAVSIAEFAVLLAYYYPLLKQVPSLNLSESEALRYDDNFVSDLLYSDSRYRVLLTALVGLHLVVCCFFVVELNWFHIRRGASCCLPVLVAELACLISAWIGWVILSSIYTDSSGKITEAHILGAGLFIGACCVYFLLVICNVASKEREKWTRTETALFALVLLCFLLSVFSGFLFMANFWKIQITGKRVMCGWIYEHASFILFMLAHVWLFLVDGKFEAHCSEFRRNESGCLSGVRIHRDDVLNNQDTVRSE
jgi:hypothetical protein